MYFLLQRNDALQTFLNKSLHSGKTKHILGWNQATGPTVKTSHSCYWISYPEHYRANKNCKLGIRLMLTSFCTDCRAETGMPQGSG